MNLLLVVVLFALVIVAYFVGKIQAINETVDNIWKIFTDVIQVQMWNPEVYEKVKNTLSDVIKDVINEEGDDGQTDDDQ